jgi:hypothetical protein
VLTSAEVARLRKGERLTVRLTPAALTRMASPRSLLGTFSAHGITEGGYVLTEYHGRDYGPTLYQADVEAVYPNPPSGGRAYRGGTA